MTMRLARRARRFALALTVAAMALAGLATPASALTITLRTTATGFSSPVFLTNAGDSRLFIVEQGGRIKVRHTTGAIGTFLDITGRVSQDGGERGLLSVAFHPDYADSARWGYRRLYVNFTDRTGDIILSEFRRNSTNANFASVSSERRLLTISHRTHANHNGGQVVFGPDKRLYLSTGDGGGTGDTANNAQNRNSLLGKIIRISPLDPSPGTGLNYAIPTDNPFYGATFGRDEVWAYGLRNPWRFSFDSTRGDLLIADVGQSRWEEVNLSRANASHLNAGRGLNYGWRCYEGNVTYNFTGCSSAGKTFPVAVYSHTLGCSITGGYVDRRATSALNQRYIFGDFCSGRIWSINADTSGAQSPSLLLDTSLNISSFGRGYTGELYVVSYSNGRIYRIAASA
jgi:glucose/arabinose dehydrogenase